MGGIPVVDAVTSSAAPRIREWPNRLGVLEDGETGDTVRWYPELAPPPTTGVVMASQLDGSPDSAGERPTSQRTQWLQSLVRSAEQTPGVRRIRTPIGAATILLTPGAGVAHMDTGHPWGPALAAVPNRLGEFPGGLQLAVTDRVWEHRDEYAEAVLAIVSGGP